MDPHDQPTQAFGPSAAPSPPPGGWAPAPGPAAPPGAPAGGYGGYPPSGPPGYGGYGYGYGGPGGWPPPQPPRRSGVGVVLGVGVVALLCAFAVVAVAVVVRSGGDSGSAEVMGSAADAPVPSSTVAESATRLAPEPALPAEDPRHTWFHTEDDGDPVTWDPCETIQYVVNDRLAPPGAMEILTTAIDRIEAATGLVFEDLGATDEPPPGLEDRPDRDPDRYGPGWSPVLIAWTDVMEDPDLDGAAGLASPYPANAPSGEVIYVTGYVEMAGDYASDLIAAGQGDDILGVMMHELGHLVGLGHVEDPTQVMTDDPNSTPTQWGAGDQYGLARLGRGECDPDI